MKINENKERKFNKWLRKCIGASLAFVAVLGACLYFGGQTVYAATAYTDTEPNDSYEQAQIISANSQTPLMYLSNVTSSYRYVTGTLSYDDEDWYKVSLKSDDKTYLDLNVQSGGPITVDVYLSSNFNDPLNSFTFKSYGGTDVYEVPVPINGVYYLRLSHTTTSIASKYYFTIGNPQYTLGTYTYKFPTTTLEAGGDWDDQVDLSLQSDIPKEAIGYEISIGGCSSSVSSKRYFTNNFFNQRWVATKSTFSYDLPATESSYLIDEWGARIVSTSKSSSTFAPTMTIKYVAPILPKE